MAVPEKELPISRNVGSVHVVRPFRSSLYGLMNFLPGCEQGAPNNFANRLRYVEMRAAAAAQTVSELAQAVNTAAALSALRTDAIEDDRKPLDAQN